MGGSEREKECGGTGLVDCVNIVTSCIVNTSLEKVYAGNVAAKKKKKGRGGSKEYREGGS